MTENFAEFIARERDRLHAEREAMFTQQQELEGQLAKINNELKAIDAYEAAKIGKPVPQAHVKRGRSGGRRPAIMAALEDNPLG